MISSTNSRNLSVRLEKTMNEYNINHNCTINSTAVVKFHNVTGFNTDINLMTNNETPDAMILNVAEIITRRVTAELFSFFASNTRRKRIEMFKVGAFFSIQANKTSFFHKISLPFYLHIQTKINYFNSKLEKPPKNINIY